MFLRLFRFYNSRQGRVTSDVFHLSNTNHNLSQALRKGKAHGATGIFAQTIPLRPLGQPRGGRRPADGGAVLATVSAADGSHSGNGMDMAQPHPAWQQENSRVAPAYGEADRSGGGRTGGGVGGLSAPAHSGAPAGAGSLH